MRKQFTFYSSFWEAVKELPEKEGNAVLRAICAYALEEDERELSSMGRIVFSLIKPTLDTAARKSAGGRKSGKISTTSFSEEKQDNDKTMTRQEEDDGKISTRQGEGNDKTNARQEEDKRKEKEVEIEVEVEKEKEVEVEKESYKEKMQKEKFTPPTREDVRAYAKERRSAVDPDQFFNYFDVGKWRDSEGKPVRNWKQKFLTWDRMQQARGGGRQPAKSFADIYREEEGTP